MTIVKQMSPFDMELNFTTAIFNAGYDDEPIYRQALDQTMRIVNYVEKVR